MEEKFPSQTQDKFTVRFPDGMRDLIAEMAKRDGRSINSEIIILLDLAIKVCRNFGPDDGPVVQQFQQKLKDLNNKTKEIEESISLTKTDMDKMVSRITNTLLEQLTKDYDFVPKTKQANDKKSDNKEK